MSNLGHIEYCIIEGLTGLITQQGQSSTGQSSIVVWGSESKVRKSISRFPEALKC